MFKVSPTLSMDLVFYTPCQPLCGRGCLHVYAYPLVCLGVHAYPYAYVLSEAIFRIGLHTCTSLSPIPIPTPTPGCGAYCHFFFTPHLFGFWGLKFKSSPWEGSSLRKKCSPVSGEPRAFLRNYENSIFPGCLV